MFTNPVRGGIGNALIKFAEMTRMERTPMKEAKAILIKEYRATGHLEKLKKELKEEIKNSNVHGIEETEEKIIHLIDKMRGGMVQTVKDVIMMYHIPLRALDELLREDEELQRMNFPRGIAEDVEKKIIEEEQRFKEDLKKERDVFDNVV